MFLVAVVALTLPSAVRAHAIGADCTLQGETVKVEAYYDDDTPARNAKVNVFDAAQKPVAEGRTNAEGVWSFARPPAGDYRVVVNAGAGHRTEQAVQIPPRAAAPAPAATVDEPPPAPPAEVSVSNGASREEFTRFPWLRVLLGLAILGTFGVLFSFRGQRKKDSELPRS